MFFYSIIAFNILKKKMSDDISQADGIKLTCSNIDQVGHTVPVIILYRSAVLSCALSQR